MSHSPNSVLEQAFCTVQQQVRSRHSGGGSYDRQPRLGRPQGEDISSLSEAVVTGVAWRRCRRRVGSKSGCLRACLLEGHHNSSWHKYSPVLVQKSYCCYKETFNFIEHCKETEIRHKCFSYGYIFNIKFSLRFYWELFFYSNCYLTLKLFRYVSWLTKLFQPVNIIQFHINCSVSEMKIRPTVTTTAMGERKSEVRHPTWGGQSAWTSSGRRGRQSSFHRCVSWCAAPTRRSGQTFSCSSAMNTRTAARLWATRRVSTEGGEG